MKDLIDPNCKISLNGVAYTAKNYIEIGHIIHEFNETEGGLKANFYL